MAFIWCVAIADVSDLLPKSINGSGSNPSEVGLELGKRHFDGVEIGAVWRGKEEPGAAVLEDRSCLLALVAR